MRRHSDRECSGINLLTETVGDGPEQRSEFKRRGTLFSVYVFKGRQWIKIGEYCATCGFHFDKEQLSKIFGNAKESTKTIVEIGGKQVLYVYSHEFPKRFNVSFDTQTKPREESRAIVVVPVPRKPDALN